MLLLRSVDFRRACRGNFEFAERFRSAAAQHMPLQPQHSLNPPPAPASSSSPLPPLWRISLGRWIRVLIDHEAFIVDILVRLHMMIQNDCSKLPSVDLASDQNAIATCVCMCVHIYCSLRLRKDHGRLNSKKCRVKPIPVDIGSGPQVQKVKIMTIFRPTVFIKDRVNLVQPVFCSYLASCRHIFIAS